MYLKFIFIFSVLGGAWAVCPSVKDVAPCTCDEKRLRFYCGSATNPEWDMKTYFDRIAKLIPEDVIIEEIVIANTNLTTFPAGAFSTVKYDKIYVEFNYQLEYIHPDAFGETVNVTSHLSIIENRKLTNEGEGHSERDLFDVITKFKNATTILIHMNKIRSIPDEGFGPLPNLKKFQLGSALISRIGSRAFSQLPNLEYAELGSCDISLNEIADDAFEGVGANAEIRMEFNPFTRLPQVPFKPLLDNARLVSVGGEEWFWGWCTNVLLDCDEESAWMCQDVEKYQSKIKGFFCKSESGYNNIWDYCAAEVKNK